MGRGSRKIISHSVAGPDHGQKPFLFVDVDGVINCFGNLGTSLVSFENEFTAYGNGRPYTIRVPDKTAENLRQLAQYFIPVWATTWENEVYQIAEEIGVGQKWPFIDFKNTSGKSWKVPDIQKYAGDIPLAWIDDEIHEDADQWANSRKIPTLLVKTTPSTGLTHSQTQSLIVWAQNL